MICGDLNKLYNECRNNFITVFQDKLQISKDNSEVIFEKMKEDDKIIIEKWD